MQQSTENRDYMTTLCTMWHSQSVLGSSVTRYSPGTTLSRKSSSAGVEKLSNTGARRSIMGTATDSCHTHTHHHTHTHTHTYTHAHTHTHTHTHTHAHTHIHIHTHTHTHTHTCIHPHNSASI